MKINTVLTVMASALFALSVPAGATGDREPIYKPGAEYYFYSGTWPQMLDLDTTR